MKVVVGQGNQHNVIEFSRFHKNHSNDQKLIQSVIKLFSDPDAELSANKTPGFFDGGFSDDDREEESESDEDSDWITPDNIKEIDDGDQLDDEREDLVSCLTIDFAMQNVLLK